MIEWYWISLSYATFGIAAENNGVITAAPIARWTKGKALPYVLNYYRSKGAEIAVLDREGRENGTLDSQ